MTSFMNNGEELNQIIENFHTCVEHPFLEKFIGKPAVDEDQAFLLYEMLKEKDFDDIYIEKCIITTALVQAALDTHDQISVKHIVNNTLQKERELTVLAGDYYSSLYYLLLAKVNDVSLIRVLAKSIQEVNESKMNIYKNNDGYVKACLQDLHKIDSSLLQNIANMLQLPDWHMAVTHFFFLKRLIKERQQLLNTGVKGFAVEVMLKEVSEDVIPDDIQIIHQFDRQIELSKDKLLEYTKNWKKLGNFFRSRVHELLVENGLYEHSVVEEG
ncbi:heptaprenyl diphosphate synthase component 1 [Evansella halocellulosilytica]|uniref:heptaprenyl diphosphate synthase component 1 n=1 Tax=Evansella halocellulosilytica TaxID=2011013 RepID=UPI000BB82601|nr:heptaprenyl diphosphate synthase component 1 [Evansella halocellulosilytica]